LPSITDEAIKRNIKMALVVNTNIAAISSRNYANESGNDMQSAIERLSSGKRINTASDDAAGLSISERMQAQIRGFNQAIRNVNDGISMVQAVDGALAEITDSLQRMRELAVQAVNGSNSASDRIALQNELSSLVEQINMTANSTRFNGMSLLNGEFGGRTIQAGASVGETVGLGFSGAKADDLKMYQARTSLTASTTVSSGLDELFYDNESVQFAEFGAPGGSSADNSIEEATLSINVRGGRETDLSGTVGQSGALLYIDQYDEASTIAAKVNASDAGVRAFAKTEVQIGLTTAETTDVVDSDDPTATVGSATFTLGSGQRAGAYTSFTIGSGNLEDKTLFAVRFAEEVNATSNVHGITATIDPDAGESVTLIQAEGRDIKMFADMNATTAVVTVKEAEIDGDNTAMEATDIIASTANTDFGFVQAGEVTFYSGTDFSIEEVGTTTSNFDTTTTSAINLGGADVTNAVTARSAIALIDSALEAVAVQRSEVGAMENRFEITASGLAVASEKQSAAYSRIVDADFASESSRLARAQILQQVSTAMLAQANAMPQVVLSLIQ
jgi:flagellin